VSFQQKPAAQKQIAAWGKKQGILGNYFAAE
jgi:hypothetical protein